MTEEEFEELEKEIRKQKLEEAEVLIAYLREKLVKEEAQP